MFAIKNKLVQFFFWIISKANNNPRKGEVWNEIEAIKEENKENWINYLFKEILTVKRFIRM